jgi:hypothetical protein
LPIAAKNEQIFEFNSWFNHSDCDQTVIQGLVQDGRDDLKNGRDVS